MNHYPHHIGDFNNATRHLTRVERSLYRDLLDLYYDTEQPLPAGDIHRLARRICCDPADISALESVLSEFFRLQGDLYTHARCDRELARYRGQIDAASRAGKASAQRRANARSTAVQRPNHQPEPEPEPIKKTSSSKRARRCPPDFSVPHDVFAAMVVKCPGLDFTAETEKFRDWEFKDGKSDWLAAWRTWMRKAFESLPAQKPQAASFRERDEAAARARMAEFTGRRADPLDNVIDMEASHVRIG